MIRLFQQERSSDYDSRPGLSEQSFEAALNLEKRRTERSGALLLLASVRLVDCQIHKDQRSLMSIARALIAVIRETDVVGWNGTGSIVRVLFTEIRGPVLENRVALLERRMRLAISRELPQDVVVRVRIAIDLFPESERHSASQYPFRPGHKAALARSIKRAVDIMVTLIVLGLCWPGLLILAVCIKLTSHGPVIYKQTRVGKSGRTFTMLKFRTMFHDCDTTVHEEFVTSLIENTGKQDRGQHKSPTYKLVNDSRITPLGRFLRRSSLDEFPQLFNVLRGDMSLVGPRPPLPYEFERYKPWHRRRVLDSIPGLTGLWQVEGRSRVTFDDAVRLDLQYIRHWSLWLDLKILVKTPKAVLSGDGAF